MAIKKESKQLGIAYEKIVAEIQAQIDPSAKVSHNEIIQDRLGHARQFDVVVRGNFAGQDMLGVIECKDLNKKVGTPEVDGFVTKSQDINANFKILMSRKGFSKPAIEKCSHYGIQPLSLIDNDPVNKNFFIGTRWEADITRWAQIRLTLHFQIEPSSPISFKIEEVRINGKKVIDWFTNYIVEHEKEVMGLGWVINILVQFDNVQTVYINQSDSYLCTGISFAAERVIDKLERMVGVSGTGFYNWSAKTATFAPNTTITSDSVPVDFSLWNTRAEGNKPPSGFIDIRFEAYSAQFQHIENVIDLNVL